MKTHKRIVDAKKIPCKFVDSRSRNEYFELCKKFGQDYVNEHYVIKIDPNISLEEYRIMLEKGII